MTRILRQFVAQVLGLPGRLHRDQEGSISILTVVAVLLLTMVLGMVMNVGRHVDEKLRMQNAADAATYSGALVIARGMNTLAFTNHLLCDVLSLDAFMREAQSPRAEQQANEVLDAWEKIAPVMSAAPIERFARAGDAITVKVPLEREMVRTYCLWVSAASDFIFPAMEEILEDRKIPIFQWAVLETYPTIAQSTATEVARLNAPSNSADRPLSCVLWRTDAELVRGSLGDGRVMPIGDPLSDVKYLNRARQRRRAYVERYLGRPGRHNEWTWYNNTAWSALSWNSQVLVAFDRRGKMCQFGQIWRSYTCGHLDQLLDVDYPNDNLPQLLKEEVRPGLATPDYLDANYAMVGVTYRPKMPELLPGLFRSPIAGDQMAFAAAHVFVPTSRPEWHINAVKIPRDEVGGFGPQTPGDPPDRTDDDEATRTWWPGRQAVPTAWSLFSQHWVAQLAPCDKAGLAAILGKTPPSDLTDGTNIRPLDLGGLDTEAINRISRH